MNWITARMSALEMDLARRVYAAGLTETLAQAQRQIYIGGHSEHAEWNRKIAVARPDGKEEQPSPI
jgi:hypothetical protein